MRRTAAALITVVSLAVYARPQEPPLVAGRDVRMPRRVHAPEPAYPKLAREARVGSFVFLEVTLNPEGGPVDVKVLRGHPLFDEAAIEAVKKWRYEPSLVGGVPQRVKLAEVVAFFLDDEMRVNSCVTLAADRGVQPGVRVFAIGRLLEFLPKQHELIEEVLRPLSNDAEQAVAAAAKSGLERLRIADKSGPEKGRGALDLHGAVIIEGERVSVARDKLSAAGVDPAAFTPPRLVKGSRPSYPDLEWRARVQGIVGLECVIDESGSVGSCRVKVSVSRGLDRAAVVAIEGWRFSPARVGDEPRSVVATFLQKFRLY